jgi:hypothetical protein
MDGRDDGRRGILLIDHPAILLVGIWPFFYVAASPGCARAREPRTRIAERSQEF